MAFTVFISYSREDTSVTKILESYLNNAGIQVWVDHERLQPGDPDWDSTIRKGLRFADVVILIASISSQKSFYVRDELAIARSHHLRVIPLWVAGDNWNDAVPLGWGSVQYCDARGPRFNDGVQELLQILTDMRGGEVVSLVTSDRATSVEPSVKPKEVTPPPGAAPYPHAQPYVFQETYPPPQNRAGGFFQAKSFPYFYWQ